MIDFEKELANFKPSREVDEVEDTIIHSDLKDAADIIAEIIKSNEKNR